MTDLGPVYLILPGFAAFILGLVLFRPNYHSQLSVRSRCGPGPGLCALVLPSRPWPSKRSLSRAGAATATFFWFLDILVGIAAATLGLIAGAFGYTLMYGLVCPAVEIAAALLYLYWHFRKQLV